MDIALTPDERAFQTEVRRFFATDYPQDILEKLRDGSLLTKADHVRSQQALQSRGWFGIGWAAEHGGPGWTPVQRYLFEQELERAGAPNIIPMAIIYIGPIIGAFGTDAQKALWLDDILQSKAMWAQGYSEPESGSDLASLGMTAVRDGDDYVLDGAKIWTSGAHWADWIFCLVRTSKEARKQDGISMICVPMDAPGVTVHPIISIDGTHELNRVTFDNVRTSVAHRIGEEGKGWHYANVLLASERVSYAHVGRKKADLAAIRAKAATLPGDFMPTMLDEPRFAARLAALEMEVAVIEISVLRALTSTTDPAMVSSLKIVCTEAAQKITELWLELAERYRAPRLDRGAEGWADALPPAMRFGAPQTASYLFERAQTIYGGATEVQRNIIWRQLARSNAAPGG
jgi:alkylation response protein AidB-like acyl-CoA dehydrogenase